MTSAAEASPAPMAPRPARVVTRRRESADTVTIALEPLDGVAVGFEAGQFAMVYAWGVGEAALSFSGGGDGRVLHTVRAVGAITRALCAAPPGTVVGVRGPFGTGWDVRSAEGGDVVVVGGGLGLAPLRPAVEAVIAHRERFGRVAVLVGARAPDQVLFAPDLEQWRSRSDIDVEVTVDAAGADWGGNVGVVTDLIAGARFDPLHTLALVCGPEVMMRFVAAGLTDRGVPPGNIRLSMERNMHCAVGHCGHCQLGPAFICRDGPVLSLDRVAPLLAVREL